MPVRLGDLLVRAGALTEAERDRVLETQQRTRRPFGVLAEELFGVDPAVVERAWAEQYALASERVHPGAETVDPNALACIDRRQAWQFAVLPMRFEAGELIVCTSVEYLPRAMRFAGWRLGERVSFVLAERRELGAALERHYPMGMTADDLLPAEALPAPRA